MEHNEAGCQVPPEAPVLCVNNCGFFGTAATMNMCSKCHKDLMLKEEQAKLGASSIGSIVNGSSTKELGVPSAVRVSAGSPELWALTTQPSRASATIESNEKIKEDGPKRCNTCRKRVGLTGFNCRCGNLFCSVHRYSDKHECPVDYRTTAQDAIAKANPVVKAQKLDKI